jgi:hypothetical protein
MGEPQTPKAVETARRPAIATDLFGKRRSGFQDQAELLPTPV